MLHPGRFDGEADRRGLHTGPRRDDARRLRSVLRYAPSIYSHIMMMKLGIVTVTTAIMVQKGTGL